MHNLLLYTAWLRVGVMEGHSAILLCHVSVADDKNRLTRRMLDSYLKGRTLKRRTLVSRIMTTKLLLSVCHAWRINVSLIHFATFNVRFLNFELSPIVLFRCWQQGYECTRRFLSQFILNQSLNTSSCVQQQQSSPVNQIVDHGDPIVLRLDDQHSQPEPPSIQDSLLSNDVVLDNSSRSQVEARKHSESHVVVVNGEDRHCHGDDNDFQVLHRSDSTIWQHTDCSVPAATCSTMAHGGNNFMTNQLQVVETQV